jgi:outer membrane protein insertion porin family
LRPNRALAALILLAPFIAPFAAHAQYSIATVTFKHPGPYTHAELLASSGLEPGQALMHDSLGNAAQRLLNTGLFSDATIDYASTGKARDIVVDLKPIPLEKLLPASFENLVWFTPDELTAGIHARVPLYRGVASDAGTLPDDIQSALQQMLTAKGITAALSHAIIEPTNLHPQLTVNFKVDTPMVLFGKANLTGVPDALKTDTLQSLQRLDGAPYNEGLTGVTIEDTVLTPARSAGYLNAKLQDIQRSPTPTSNGLAVTYAATFIPGDAYKVSTITWNPTPLYSAADFARDAKLHPGDPASDSALRNTEAPISKAYLLQGYLDVYVLPHPVLDAANHTVAYTLTTVPGDIYHLHSVNVDGLSPQARALFDADWPMKPGDPYSDIVVNTYLIKHAAQPLFRTYGPTFRAVGDPQTHLVDLTLTFTPNGSKVY